VALRPSAVHTPPPPHRLGQSRSSLASISKNLTSRSGSGSKVVSGDRPRRCDASPAMGPAGPGGCRSRCRGIEPWAYLRGLFCLVPSWPAPELAPAFWKEALVSSRLTLDHVAVLEPAGRVRGCDVARHKANGGHQHGDGAGAEGPEVGFDLGPRMLDGIEVSVGRTAS